MKAHLNDKRFIVIDLKSGRYVREECGHESFNLIKNPYDGEFYGYCPPLDHINISRLGAAKQAESVSGVMVIYVQKVSDSSNREIVAFCDDATVYRVGRIKHELNRYISREGMPIECSYTVVSHYIYNLESYSPHFVIDISKYNELMFRGQRFFKGEYPGLDDEMTKYLERYLNEIDQDNDLFFQQQIQEAEPVERANTFDSEPKYSSGSVGRMVEKDAKRSKSALQKASYKCAADPEHITFRTSRGVQYMEGHHLIPCTYTNSEYYWSKFHKNIDCVENIVCLCPICHRKIHFGSDKEKKSIIVHLYELTKNDLARAGLNISLNELLELYIH